MTLLMYVALVAAVADDRPETTPVTGETAAVADRAGPDRSAPPAVLPAVLLEHPEPVVHTLGSGVEVWHVRVPSVRKVEIDVVFEGGAVALLGQEDGLGSMTGWLMDAATDTYDSTSLEIVTDLNDVSLTSSLGPFMGTVGVALPVEDVDLGLDLLEEVLRTPRFAKRDLVQYQREIDNWYHVSATSHLGAVASAAIRHGWYPADHAFSARIDVDHVLAQKPRALRDLHARWLVEVPVAVLVVGDVAYEDVAPRLEALLDGVGLDGERAPEPPFVPPEGTRVLAVDMPGQDQVAVHLRVAAPAQHAPDYLSAKAADWILGGHFLSRLNANLREEKGLTYGSRSRYYSGDTQGSITISVDVAAENAAVAVQEISHELARLIDAGVTEDELGAYHSTVVSEWNDRRQTAESAMSFYRVRFNRQERVADARALVDARAALSTADVQDVARRYLCTDCSRLWVLAGARDDLTAQLEELGWEAEWITASDAIFGSFD